jgi:hypothetical protein
MKLIWNFVANHAFILIRHAKLSTRNTKFMFKQFIISNSLAVNYKIIIFYFNKELYISFWFQIFKTPWPETGINIIIYISIITTL